jgi:hypothetical protein
MLFPDGSKTSPALPLVQGDEYSQLVLLAGLNLLRWLNRPWLLCFQINGNLEMKEGERLRPSTEDEACYGTDFFHLSVKSEILSSA